jgi:hypothetical protein
LKNNEQTRESTALSVAYNVERWRRGWEGIVGRRRRVATWTYPYNCYSRLVDPILTGLLAQQQGTHQGAPGGLGNPLDANERAILLKHASQFKPVTFRE